VENLELMVDILKSEGILLPRKAIGQFSLYHQLLQSWNQKINLISPGDAERIITRHFLESMGISRVLDFPESDSVLDLGSGAGFPGLPIKIIRPDIRMILVESIRKKVLFLEHVVGALQLDGVRIMHGRMEKMAAGLEPVHHIVCRAVSDLSTLMEWCGDCLAPGIGRLIVLKGEEVFNETEDLKKRRPGRLVGHVEVRPYQPFHLELRPKPTYLAVIQRA